MGQSDFVKDDRLHRSCGCCLTGMRRRGGGGPRWSDVDLDGQVLTVRQRRSTSAASSPSARARRSRASVVPFDERRPLVSVRLDHSSMGFTANRYTHVVPAVAKDAADRIADVVPLAAKREKRADAGRAHTDVSARKIN